ncbi:MAG TPA: hypothetical protein VMV46_11370, partial [Thermoanaerobaculia bacterium]|nr:hypothetical protein [Thermoanaerobaculia bacterium]
MRLGRFWLVVTGAAVILLGCAHFTDAAVRLATCTRDAASLSQGLTCDLRVDGGYSVILHPAGDISSRELLAAGLSSEEITSLLQLRLGLNPAVYVIPDSPSPRPSFTTSQDRYVRIPRLLVTRVPAGQVLELTITEAGGELTIVAARSRPR